MVTNRTTKGTPVRTDARNSKPISADDADRDAVADSFHELPYPLVSEALNDEFREASLRAMDLMATVARIKCHRARSADGGLTDSVAGGVDAAMQHLRDAASQLGEVADNCALNAVTAYVDGFTNAIQQEAA
jgi:hypothetical protein